MLNFGSRCRAAFFGRANVQKWLKQGRFPEKPGEIALEKHFAKFQKAGPGDTFLI
jgi:hypothetical protein